MRTIEVDEAVYRYIQSQAIPFEEPHPNDTLARIFGLRAPSKGSESKSEEKDLDEFIENLLKSAPQHRTKAPKANLSELSRRGLVSDGEVLTLIDYSGNRIAGTTARVSGDQLVYEGRSYSMSELARILLKKHGYRSEAMRGPAHWETSKGKTIKDLWGQVLNEASAEKADG